MSLNWPDDLVNDISKRKCVLFLGSGVSMNSKNDKGISPPSWKGFIESGAELLKDISYDHYIVLEKYVDCNDLLMACEVLRYGLGRDEFIKLLKDKFQSPRYHHADIHSTIFELDSRIVITPNFDKIYDTYTLSETQGSVVITTYKDKQLLDCIRRDEPVIVKIHGTIDSPGDLIFSRKDYSKAWHEHRKFYRIIESLMLTHTFLFIGAGLNDPDVRLLLESISFGYYPSRKHYFLIPSEEIDEISEKIYSDLLNIQFLKYSSADNHAELKNSLVELKDKVEIRRNSTI